jgi:hypothetical protein
MTILSIFAQSLLTQTAMCVMMSISAFLFSWGWWYIRQFFMLITHSLELEPEPELDDSSVSAEALEDWQVG